MQVKRKKRTNMQSNSKQGKIKNRGKGRKKIWLFEKQLNNRYKNRSKNDKSQKSRKVEINSKVCMLDLFEILEIMRLSDF